MAQLSSTQREEHSDITKGRERTDSPWDPAFCFQGPCRPPPDSHEGLPTAPGASAPAERARKERRLFLVFWVFLGGREGKNFCFVLFVLFCFVSSWRSRGIGTALASGSFLSRHQLAGVHSPHSPARESVAQVAGCQSRIQGGIKKSL